MKKTFISFLTSMLAVSLSAQTYHFQMQTGTTQDDVEGWGWAINCGTSTSKGRDASITDGNGYSTTGNFNLKFGYNSKSDTDPEFVGTEKNLQTAAYTNAGTLTFHWRMNSSDAKMVLYVQTIQNGTTATVKTIQVEKDDTHTSSSEWYTETVDINSEAATAINFYTELTAGATSASTVCIDDISLTVYGEDGGDGGDGGDEIETIEAINTNFADTTTWKHENAVDDNGNLYTGVPKSSTGFTYPDINYGNGWELTNAFYLWGSPKGCRESKEHEGRIAVDKNTNSGAIVTPYVTSCQTLKVHVSTGSDNKEFSILKQVGTRAWSTIYTAEGIKDTCTVHTITVNENQSVRFKIANGSTSTLYVWHIETTPTSGDTTAINEIEETPTHVNVYNLQGILVRKNVETAYATEGLTPGIYIVGNKKVLVTR